MRAPLPNWIAALGVAVLAVGEGTMLLVANDDPHTQLEIGIVTNNIAVTVNTPTPNDMIVAAQTVSASGCTISAGKRVAIIGDSLTYQNTAGQKSLPKAFEASGWPREATWLYGVPGKMINTPDHTGKTTVQVIARARAVIGEPDVWVIALGTNDASHRRSQSQIVTAIQTVLAALGSDAKVAWVNTAGGPNDDFSTVNGTVNAAIAAAMSGRPHSLLIDWSAYITSVDRPSYWRDRVHMTWAGYDVRNKYIAEQSAILYCM